LRSLPQGHRPNESTVSTALRKPEAYLASYAKRPVAGKGRALAMLAMLRLAAAEPAAAAGLLEGRLAKDFAHQDRTLLWARIGMEGSRRHADEALEWFARAGSHALGDEEAAWKVRAALRAGDWTLVRDTVDAMSPEARHARTWTYWYGRALAALGNAEGARAHWLRIAGEPRFYGLLATEALGDVAVLPPLAPPATDAQVEAESRVPGLARALELYRLGLRSEAVREWLFTVRAYTDDARLLAAQRSSIGQSTRRTARSRRMTFACATWRRFARFLPRARERRGSTRPGCLAWCVRRAASSSMHAPARARGA
ncbi:MAG: hypothetical protein O2975_07435, partial [Proteobacteria bacterium]|nr:hypothetical protein [Pseudomonadota bacterium]